MIFKKKPTQNEIDDLADRITNFIMENCPRFLDLHTEVENGKLCFIVTVNEDRLEKIMTEEIGVKNTAAKEIIRKVFSKDKSQ